MGLVGSNESRAKEDLQISFDVRILLSHQHPRFDCRHNFVIPDRDYEWNDLRSRPKQLFRPLLGPEGGPEQFRQLTFRFSMEGVC